MGNESVILVCDDDKLILDGVANALSEAKLGTVLCAKNGREGIALYRGEKPTLIITDINMPKMDGLEMVRAIREEDEKVKIIFLTGYAEIDYLKAAFKNDAVDFLLKPVDPEELLQAAGKAIRLYMENEASVSQLETLKKRLREALPAYRDKYFTTLVQGGIAEPGSLREKLEYMELQLNEEDDYTVFLLLTHVDKRDSEWEKEIKALLLLQTVRAQVSSAGEGFVFLNPRNRVVGVLIGSDHHCLYRSILRACEHLAGGAYVIGVGVTVSGLSNIGESYTYAENSASSHFSAGETGVFYGSEGRIKQCNMAPPDPSLLSALLRSVGESDRAGAVAAAGDISDKVHRFEDAAAYYTSVFLELYHAFFKRRDDALIMISEFQTGLSVCENLPEIKNFFLTSIKGYLHLRGSANGENRSIFHVKEIIDREYGENLSLNEIAKRVYLSVSYLCALFKQRTGTTVNDYLTKRRIEQAKILLSSPDYKLYEVAEKVGYQDQRYFSRLFRRMTGLSPSEYRKERLNM